MNNILEIKNLSVCYDNVCALKNVNLNVKRNDFLAILGPNGGGKSTLLKSILGLIKPSEGSIKVLNDSSEKSACPIGYVPQFSKFDKRFPINVFDVVLSGTLTAKKTFLHRYSLDDKKNCMNVLETLEISNLKNRQIGELSGGQLQRVLIARALATNSNILLLDEPTASLDANSKTQIYSLLTKLNKDKTIIMVSHDLEFVCSYVNSIACLNKTLHYHGKPSLESDLVEHIYGCPVDLIAHGVPHRVLNSHKE